MKKTTVKKAEVKKVANAAVTNFKYGFSDDPEATVAALDYANEVIVNPEYHQDAVESSKQDFLAGYDYAMTGKFEAKRTDMRLVIRETANKSKYTAKELALIAAMYDFDFLKESVELLPMIVETIENQPYDDDMSDKVKDETYKVTLEGYKKLGALFADLHDAMQNNVIVLEEGAKI